ncbi:MAG TPA: phosphotyrosine protein phosphatase [Patescibacteria group bacterium]|nr:phosphotyrosine protein phosphatase [Patescibacteria group bacterium]
MQDANGVKFSGRKRVLFVCSGNIDRSPTAEALLREKEGFEVKSAGTWAGARTAVSKELIDWADMIFVMEEHHKEALIRIDQNAEAKIIVLDVDDHYLKGDPELMRILKGRLSEYLGTVFSPAAKEKKGRTA